MAVSRDVEPPRWGPGFLSFGSVAYRLEYAAATVAVFGLLFGWRLALLHDLGPQDVALSIFWFVWPDLLAFVPIGLARRKDDRWPEWGPTLYNVPHSLLVWAGVFVAWGLLAHGVVWPLLGWAGHITMDRAAGYHLRARSDEPPP